MNFLLIIVSSSISVLVLYFLNRKFNYKSKLLKLFRSVFIYKAIFFISFLVFSYIYIFNFDKSVFENPLGMTMLCSYLYLVQVSKDLL